MEKILVSMPTGLIAEVDAVVKDRYRSRSEFVREALRARCDEISKVEGQKRAAEVSQAAQEGEATA